MNEKTQNSPLDVCRVLGIALLADNKIEDREIEALTELRIGDTLGVSPADFRKVLHELCKGALVDEAGHPNATVTELKAISEMSSLLGRDIPADRDSVKRLIELINDTDPTLFSDQLLDENYLNATLDRITDKRLQLWTGSILLRLIPADATADAKEKMLLRHVLKRWGISPEAIAG